MDVAQQIDFMVRYFMQARTADKNMMSASSINSIKNQMLASNLIRDRKSHGFNKAVAQGFLKNMLLRPYGSMYKINKHPL